MSILTLFLYNTGCTCKSSAIRTNGLTFVSCSKFVTTMLNFFMGIYHAMEGEALSAAPLSFSHCHRCLKWYPKDRDMWKTNVVLFGPNTIYRLFRNVKILKAICITILLDNYSYYFRNIHSSSGRQFIKAAAWHRPVFVVPMVLRPPGWVPNKCAPGFSR